MKRSENGNLKSSKRTTRVLTGALCVLPVSQVRKITQHTNNHGGFHQQQAVRQYSCAATCMATGNIRITQCQQCGIAGVHADRIHFTPTARSSSVDGNNGADQHGAAGGDRALSARHRPVIGPLNGGFCTLCPSLRGRLHGGWQEQASSCVLSKSELCVLRTLVSAKYRHFFICTKRGHAPQDFTSPQFRPTFLSLKCMFLFNGLRRLPLYKMFISYIAQV